MDSIYQWSIVGSFTFLSASFGLFGELPDFRRLENPDTNLASEIISSDGQTLGKFYLDDNRTPVAYEDLPDHLVKALVATEDERYYKHSGIDAIGTMRAVVYLGSKGGASTITQQLARQLFVGVRSKNIFQAITQKIKEWVIAVQLERQYTKEEIIMMYFNIYDFNNQADGIRSASRIYFGKEPKELTVDESAVLVGMFKNSSLYNPRRNPQGVTNRRNVVLGQMAKSNFITKQQRDSLQQLPLEINYNPESHKEGVATYFREYLRAYLKEWIDNNPKAEGGKHNLYLDGLKIYTTIDSRMQRYAEEAVTEHMTRLQAEYFVQNTTERNKTTPFVGISEKEIDNILERAMKTSDRWRFMKAQGKSEKEIRASFNKPIEMEVFTWQGEKDTIMTPLDSIRYYKTFLRTGMMSMEPQTGYVKAWVGELTINIFNTIR